MRVKDRAEIDKFDFPSPPERIPEWAWQEAGEWQKIDEFDLLVKAEKRTNKIVDLKYVAMYPGMWGLHVGKGHHVMIYINNELPTIWKRFALFHELYHLLNHRRGHSFWARTATPMRSFEYQADIFAWAAIWPEWTED